MLELSQIDPKPAAARPKRRGWTLFFAAWTMSVVLIVWWVIDEAAKSENTLIRVGPDEVKSWMVRLRETAALARLNLPWALSWILLAPYVLWVGVRYSFDTARWQSRSLILLGAAASFVAGSQWLSARLGAGDAMIVMVNYNAETTFGKSPHDVDRRWDELLPQALGTNLVASNRVTRVMISSSAAHSGDSPFWEGTRSKIISDLTTNLPAFIAGELMPDLPRPKRPPTVRSSAVLDGFAFIALIGLAHAGVFHRRYREREGQAALLATRLNEARLHALQAQLQPHFLFNTLNGIATLLRRDPAKAEDMLLSLSELLRIALSSSQRQEIPLREELDFLGRYLGIQKMRFGDRLQVTEEIEPAALECLVPALLLQPLVENAIRHGLEPSGQPGQLRISGSRDGEWLKLAVEDNGVGLKPGGSRTGVGLANVRERLATLHGSSYAFELGERPEGGVAVNIKLPARTESAAEQGNAAVPAASSSTVPVRGSGTGGGTPPELAGEDARATRERPA